MAKGLSLVLNGKESVFGLSSMDRAAVYGKRRRIALDTKGEPCIRVSLLADGSMALKSGMTGQGYFLPDGTSLKQAELEAFSLDGKPLTKVPSSLGNPQELSGPVSPKELLDTRITSIYVLDPESFDDGLKSSLANGDIYRFTFTFRDSYSPEDAFVFQNKEGVFVLAGDTLSYEWSSLATLATLPAQDDFDDDDLDFDML